MARPSRTRNLILMALSDGKPKSCRDLVRATRLSPSAVGNGLRRCWKGGFILRTGKPLYEAERIFKGRGGLRSNTRPYYLYVLRQGDVDSAVINGLQYVKFSSEYLDARGGGRVSKAQLILKFLEENRDRAWFSTEVAEALKNRDVKVSDVMASVRRFEKKGLVYVRGYRTHDRQTPFKEGYLMTALDQNKLREQALEEAIQRTNMVLEHRDSTSPVIQRIRSVRDTIIESTKLKDLVSFSFIQDKLNCTEYEAKTAIKRTLQLYPDLRQIKLFGQYKYYYHASLDETDLKACIAMKENYIRKTKGRYNRIGHNWEAVPEWFIDKFTTGAKFWSQEHRTKGMDPRRITIHLIRPVGGRRQNAEVDRVWEVTPSIFAQPITYVLSCKWGLVRKRDVDDFLEVLRWSKEFGVDTPEGRQVKQGVIGVFAGSAFKLDEKVRLRDETEISLATYVSRMNIQLLKAADFNGKLREKGMPKAVTVQKICRYARNEKEVREVLEAIWENPERSKETLAKVAEKNKEVYEFEEMLEKR